MKKNELLIITQKVDISDPILGFFHSWIVEFAKHYDHVSVICLEKGQFNLPQNVQVYSLEKEKGRSRIKYIFNFYRYIFRLRNNYDTVFVHMNPEYIALGGVFWKIMGKKIALWYTHRESNFKLWLAEKLSDIIFTSSLYSFTLASKKIHIMGHGINTELFGSIARKIDPNKKLFIHVGRITKIKNCDVLIEAANILKQKFGGGFKIQFLGDTITKQDATYKNKLIELTKKYGLEEVVEFVGEIAPKNMPDYYAKAWATINLAPTGGVDKAVIESMAAGVPAFASNLSFAEIFGEYKKFFLFKEGDANDLTKKIVNYFSINNTDEMEQNIKQKVNKMFDVSNFIDRICFKLYETGK
jgi:glycosyltransferase involved in cell wall biosynthesis